MDKIDLMQKIQEEKISKSCYSFSEANEGEVWVLLQKDNWWEVYYSERGNKNALKKYLNEEEACEYFYSKIINYK